MIYEWEKTLISLRDDGLVDMPGIFFTDIKNKNGIKSFKDYATKYNTCQKIEEYNDGFVYIGITSVDCQKRLFFNDDCVLAIDGYVVIDNVTITTAETLYDKIKNIDFKNISQIIISGSFNIIIYTINNKIMYFVNDRFNYILHYFYKDKERLIIAPRVENILKSLQKKLSIKRDSIEDLVYLGHLTLDNTFFNCISSIPPATSLIYNIKDKNLTEKKYWYFTNHKEKRNVTTDELFEKLKKAVKRLPKGGKEIVSLSGGLDSRLVYALTDCNDSIVYGKKNCSEIKFAERIIKKNGRHLSVVDMFTPQKLYENLFESVELSEGMNSLNGSYHNLVFYKYIREKGYDTFVSGLWGDAVVGGSFFYAVGTKYIQQMKNILVGYIQPTISKGEAVNFTFDVLSGHKIKKVRDLELYVKMFDSFDIPSVIEWTKILNKRRGVGNAESAGRNIVYEIYPFWDYELVDLCLSMKYKERGGKKIYIKLFREKLHEYCTPSTSTGGLPLYTPHYLIRIFIRVSQLQNFLLKKFGIINSYVDMDELFGYDKFQKMIKERLMNGIAVKKGIIKLGEIKDILKSNDKRMIMNLLTFEIWLNLYIDFIDVDTLGKISINNWIK